jgi:hypothetical protein
MHSVDLPIIVYLSLQLVYVFETKLIMFAIGQTVKFIKFLGIKILFGLTGSRF